MKDKKNIQIFHQELIYHGKLGHIAFLIAGVYIYYFNFILSHGIILVLSKDKQIVNRTW